jgi:glycosyltransferase involved in cell wall biosynthesis
LEVAAIIPAYNSAHWLRPCIESILGQTYPITEIIVIDDGSQDNTREVVESYGNAVRYYWRPNGGLSAARNTGVEQTTSPWIAFLDADDRWTPRKIELQVRALEANPQAVLCYTRMVLVSPDGAQQVGELTPPDRLWPILRYANQITPSTVVMSRDAFLKAGRFDEELKACEDWDLWFRLGPQSRMVAVDEPVTLYRLTPNSLSSKIDLMLASVERMLAKTLLRDLTGWRRWCWRRRVWSAELWRCAVTAREVRSPRALPLLLRSIATWPLPWFIPMRFKSLLVYLLRPTLASRTKGRIVAG